MALYCTESCCKSVLGQAPSSPEGHILDTLVVVVDVVDVVVVVPWGA